MTDAPHPAQLGITPPSLALLGAGSMGTALLRGWRRAWPDHTITVMTRRHLQATDLSPLQVLLPRDDNPDHNPPPDVVVCATKPNDLSSALSRLTRRWPDASPVLISLCAGVRVETLQHWWHKAGGSDQARWCRAMPNTPVALGQGCTVLFADASITPTDRSAVGILFSSVGLAIWIGKEDLLNAATAICGSGPAYLYLFGEAMIEAGIALGLGAEQAAILVRQTLLGASTMALQAPTREDLTALRHAVTSPNGTTQAALNVLDAPDGLRSLLARATKQALNRANDLSPSRSSH